MYLPSSGFVRAQSKYVCKHHSTGTAFGLAQYSFFVK